MMVGDTIKQDSIYRSSSSLNLDIHEQSIPRSDEAGIVELSNSKIIPCVEPNL